jgi:hypothetical protein
MNQGTPLIAFLLLLLSAPFLDGQNEGAEKTKLPVRASITGTRSLGPEYKIGNVRVTYSDGTTDLWTFKGNCAEPKVSTKGSVGWEVYELGADGKALATYNGLYINNHVRVCDHGKVVANLEFHQRRGAACDQIARRAWTGHRRTLFTSQWIGHGSGPSLREKLAGLGGAVRRIVASCQIGHWSVFGCQWSAKESGSRQNDTSRAKSNPEREGCPRFLKFLVLLSLPAIPNRLRRVRSLRLSNRFRTRRCLRHPHRRRILCRRSSRTRNRRGFSRAVIRVTRDCSGASQSRLAFPGRWSAPGSLPCRG